MPRNDDAAEMLRADLDTARREWRKAADNDPQERQRREQSDFLAAVNHEGEALSTSTVYVTRRGPGWR